MKKLGHFRSKIKNLYTNFLMKIVKSETFLLKNIMLHILKIKNIDPNIIVPSEMEQLKQNLEQVIYEKKVFPNYNNLPSKIEETIFSFQEKVNSTKRQIRK